MGADYNIGNRVDDRKNKKVERLARGWAHFIRTVERMRREERGEPLMRVINGGERRAA